MTDLIESLTLCSVALFDARTVALDANRHDVVAELRVAQMRVNAALAAVVPDLVKVEAAS